MASSKVMVSTSPTNPDLPRFTPNEIINSSLGSMDMNDLLKDMYTDGEGGGGSNNEVGMTLEAYLAKAGAVTEDDVRGNYGIMNSAVYQEGIVLQNCLMDGFGGEDANLGFVNGVVEVGGMSGGDGGGVGGRGKRRRGVEDVGLDKATQQKQRRMIKNRESASRSRERKQAYTVELEALVARLEEENARLLKEGAELKKQRFEQLIEKRRARKAGMHRSFSMTW